MKNHFDNESEDTEQYGKEMRRLARRNRNMDYSKKYATSKEEKQMEKKIKKERKQSKRRFEKPLD